MMLFDENNSLYIAFENKPKSWRMNSLNKCEFQKGLSLDVYKVYEEMFLRKIFLDSSTPPKDGPTLAKEAALLATPSCHGSVKPTSLCTNDVVAATNVVEGKLAFPDNRDNKMEKFLLTLRTLLHCLIIFIERLMVKCILQKK